MANITWLKRYLKINYFKYYNRIIKILVESGSSPPSLTSSATIHRPNTRTDKSASSRHIPLVHRTDSIGRFQHCASFGFFQIGHLLFTKITFFDTCQKMVSTHVYTYDLEYRLLNTSPKGFWIWNKWYNEYLGFIVTWHVEKINFTTNYHKYAQNSKI